MIGHDLCRVPSIELGRDAKKNRCNHHSHHWNDGPHPEFTRHHCHFHNDAQHTDRGGDHDDRCCGSGRGGNTSKTLSEADVRCGTGNCSARITPHARRRLPSRSGHRGIGSSDVLIVPTGALFREAENWDSSLSEAAKHDSPQSNSATVTMTQRKFSKGSTQETA